MEHARCPRRRPGPDPLLDHGGGGPLRQGVEPDVTSGRQQPADRSAVGSPVPGEHRAHEGDGSLVGGQGELDEPVQGRVVGPLEIVDQHHEGTAGCRRAVQELDGVGQGGVLGTDREVAFDTDREVVLDTDREVVVDTAPGSNGSTSWCTTPRANSRSAGAAHARSTCIPVLPALAATAPSTVVRPEPIPPLTTAVPPSPSRAPARSDPSRSSSRS